MIVTKEHTNQQIHEEKRADKDEEDCIAEVNYLAVVFYWALNNTQYTVSDASMKLNT